jgi:cytochrome c556
MRPFHFAAIGAALVSTVAAATPLNSSQVVDGRKARYRELGAAFKTINDQLRSGTLIKITLRSAARTINVIGTEQYQWFPAGADARTGVKTRALPAIWSNATGFRQAQGNFQRQADLLLRAVETGDQTRIRAQARAVGQTCAACHRPFRAEED